MFYRLISNLQYSPGLIGQVGYYTKRLKQEEMVRRVGLVFTVLALVMQGFLIISPPQASIASHGNDIVYGGGNRQQIIDAYRYNNDSLGRKDIRAIYERFGVEEAQLNGTHEVTIWSNPSNNYYSIGRHAQHFNGESVVEVPGHSSVYIRPLSAWNRGGPAIAYPALKGTTKNGKTFWILKDCGNIVIDTPTPEPLPPEIQIEKSVKTPVSNTVLLGEEITYSIRYRNIGPGNAGFMAIRDLVPAHTTYVSASGPVRSVENGLVIWDHLDETQNPFGLLGPTDWWHEVFLTVRVNDDAPNGQEICNVAVITAIGDEDRTGAKDACRTVYIPKIEPQAAATCNLLSFRQNTRDEFEFSAVGGVENNATISSFTFNFGDGNTVDIPNDGNNMAETTHTYAEPGEYASEVIVNSSEGPKTNEFCRQIITVDEPGEYEIVHRKKAANPTQNIDDANGTTAQAGDRIRYTLVTENVGDADAEAYELPAEDINDILEYADLVEHNDAIFDTEKGVLTWEPTNIAVGEVIEKVFVVQIKDPIPDTPVSTSHPASFDLQLRNQYGNDIVEIDLPKSTPKQVEEVVQTLPNTGIGDSIVTSTFLIGMSTYFYSRNRLITKELKLIKREFTHG